MQPKVFYLKNIHPKKEASFKLEKFRKMEKRKSILSYILLVIAIIVVVNILSDRFFARLDLTEDKRYSLSDASKNILDDLEEPITVKAYFTEEGLPPNVLKVRRDFKEMLVEFGNLSHGNVVYEFIDPSKDAEIEQEAMQNGIQPVIISVREKDQMKQQKAYMGAVISLGTETDVIPFMQEGSAMEYALSTSIKKLAVTSKPSIGFLQGHGEPALQEMQQAMQALGILYEVDPVYLNDTTEVLGKYTTLAIVAPKDSFPYSHLRQLDDFLARGGKLFIGMDRVNGDLQTAQGTEITTGLETWLEQKGLVVESNFIVDQSCANVTVRQQQGFFVMNRPVPFHFLPIINTFEDHPITKGLEMVMLPFASTITFVGDSSLRFTPIAKTSKKSGTQPCPTQFDVSRKWAERDFPLSNLPVAGVLSGKIQGDNESTIVLVSDGGFAVNGEGQQAQQHQPDNISLFVNSIDWLSDDTGLIELRTKGVTARPLDQIEDSTKALLKWLNFLLPILIILIYGIIRMQRNRILRVKRMEKGYV